MAFNEFTELKVASLNRSCCPSKSPELKDSPFKMTENIKCQCSINFDELEPGNVWHFSSVIDFKLLWIIIIVADRLLRVGSPQKSPVV